MTVRRGKKTRSKKAPSRLQGKTVYDRVKHLLGAAKGGPPDLASKSEEYLREMFARRRREY